MKSELSSSCDTRLILVNPGSFIMGSPPDEVGRAYFERQREVTLPHEFYLGLAPVTQRQFERVIPCPKYASASWAEDRPTNDPSIDARVDSVGWQGATDFCTMLTQIDRDAGILSKDWEYRLPTETEWEYACRAGTSGASYGPLDFIGWHFGNADSKVIAGGPANSCLRRISRCSTSEIYLPQRVAVTFLSQDVLGAI